MSRYFDEPASLSTKYAIGEIVDMVGTPDVYSDGKSTWLKTGTWVDATDVPDAVRDNIKKSASNLTALTDNSLIEETYAKIPGLLPPAIVGDTRCFPYSSSAKDTSAWAFVVNADGVSIRSVGQICGYASNGTTGGGNAIVSDGTKFLSFASNSGGTGFEAKSSVDGISWTDETLTGQATFAGLQSYPINMGGAAQGVDSLRHGIVFNGITNVMISVWCGARFLMIGRGASYSIAQRSSNGTSFGGDETAAILGSASLSPANSNYWWSYRNELNFFIALGSVARKSSDGGVTWGAATNAIGASASNAFRVNSTDNTRIMNINAGSATGAVSVDSGQTWSTITLPVAPGAGATLYGRGSFWSLCTSSGVTYVTDDDGSTWSVSVTLPALEGPVIGVYADENRWYVLSLSSNQIATSTDFATWTIRNIQNPGPGSTYIPYSIASTDTDHITLCSKGVILYSVDGGVIWQWASGSSATISTGVGVNHIVPCGTFLVSGSTGLSSNSTCGLYIAKSDLDNGGKFVRSSTVAVTPLRTNALAYSRVG